MKICIVDDEQNCIDELKDLISMYGTKHSIDISFDLFTDGAAFKESYVPDRYDIVFLDIYIDEITGMELADTIRSRSENNMIIFCTTSLSDMPEAFRYHAFEYIIKPPVYERIEKILDDAIAILPKLEKYIELPSGEDAGVIAISSIISVTTSGHYLDIAVTGDKTFTERMSLSSFNALLDGDSRFLLVNKGIIVNMDHIENIKDRICLMNNGSAFPVKVRESAAIKKHWQDYNFDKIRKGQKGR